MQEFDIIRQYCSTDSEAKDVLVGIGDDAAIVKLEGDCSICSDTMVAGVHFPDKHIDYEALGEKLVAVNVSDTLAMNALPHHAVLNLSAGSGFDFAAFYKGLNTACAQYGIVLVGGDTTQSAVSVLSLTLMGQVQQQPVLRSGAQVGDWVVLSGSVGFAAAALDRLRQGESLDDCLYDAYWRPCVDLRSQALVQRASACIDVSDALVQDLNHIAVASGVGMCLQRSALIDTPLARYAKSDQQLLDWVLYGGDDYKLCFTVGKQQQECIKKLVQSEFPEAVIIGEVINRCGIYLDIGTETKLLPIKGFQHRF